MASQVDTSVAPAGDAAADAAASTHPGTDTDANIGDGDDLDAGSNPDPGAGVGAGVTRIDLPATADIRVAAEIFALCRAALEATGDVEVACDAVERIDAAILQCLVALARGLDQAHRQFAVLDPTPAFVRAADTVGLGHTFDRQLATA